MHNQDLPENAKGEASRALVVFNGDHAGTGEREEPVQGACARAMAGFVTQLIACRRRLPGYRSRRSADPREASRIYDATDCRPAPARRAFERLY
jgi:hypothetical protein